MISLVVFARLPIAGQVKTRIANASSPDFALSLYQKLLERILNAASIAVNNARLPAQVVWHYDGEMDDVALPMLPRMAEFFAHPERMIRQVPVLDLGARMHAALNYSGGPTILVGSDIPSLDASRLGLSLERLLPDEMIFNPTTDGGYCLVGKGFTNAAPMGIFENIEWSTPQVMAQTRAQLNAHEVAWSELEALSDVDDLAAAERFLNGE
jgi:uncharacterized protein